MVTLQAPGRSGQVPLLDVSRGGALLDCNWTLSPGAQVQIELPAAGSAVSARVVRRESNGLALVFAADSAALARIDRALDAIGGHRAAA
jgi:PilZ domain